MTADNISIIQQPKEFHFQTSYYTIMDVEIISMPNEDKGILFPIANRLSELIYQFLGVQLLIGNKKTLSPIQISFVRNDFPEECCRMQSIKKCALP